ncbi:MAG: hypothetical protein FWB82_04035 [Treponema sp.]|nr:hypothetical protein [Treponema sp.]
MTTFQRSQLTLHGLQRIARAHEGERMVFTGMGLGDVMLTGNLNELTSLEGERQRFPLAGSNVSGNSFWASIRPTQINDPEGLYVRSIGLYIADPANEDDRSFDKLYAVSTVTPNFHGAADAIAFIPHNLSGAEVNYDIRLNTIISPTALVEIVGGIGNIGIATVPELGFVRSSNEHFDVGVDHGSGRMSVNGLSEEIAGIKEDIARLLEGAGSFGGDVSNVVNSPWFNPGTMLGGISWSDPTIEFEYIEIVSVLGGGEVIARIEPGVQFWQAP